MQLNQLKENAFQTENQAFVTVYSRVKEFANRRLPGRMENSDFGPMEAKMSQSRGH